MIISACSHSYSPPEYNVLTGIQCDIPLVLVTRLSNFQFNEELRKLDRYVLVCMSEYNWDWDLEKSGTHIWGKNTNEFQHFKDNPEWQKFDEWVASNNPVLMFKRELLKRDVTENIIPIDYPNYQHPFPIQTREQFNNRPIEVCMFWGRSSEYRVRLHSEIWSRSSRNGASISDNIYQIQNFLQHEQNPKKWVTCHQPHFQREQLSTLLQINGLSKLSVSLPGCGTKCFRSTGESPVNSVMVKHKDSLAWAYNWQHNHNCIEVEPGDEIYDIERALEKDYLYEIYLESVETANKYKIHRYTKEYLEKSINERI